MRGEREVSVRDHDAWKRILSDLDPYRVLRPDEVQRLYADRPDASSQEIYDEIALAVDPRDVRVFLAGARGAGKTTELLRLRARFTSGEHVVIPLYIDIAAVLPENSRTRTWLPILATAVRAVRLDWSNEAPGAALENAMVGVGRPIERFRAALGAIGAVAKWAEKPLGALVGTVASATAAVNAPELAPVASAVAAGATDAAIRAVAALAHPPKAGEAPEEDDAAVDALLAAMREDIDAIALAAGRPPLLLLDGFDKRGSVESVLDALDEADLLYQLPAPLVVSGPVQLSLDARFAAHLLPGRFRCVVHHNLPVVDKQGAEKDAGVAVLVELFQRRWEATGLDGPPVLDAGAVRAAARWSSGIVREFLELVRRTAMHARRNDRQVANGADLAAAVRDRRMDYERTITTDLWDQLAQVLTTRERPRADVDELLFTNRVACYPNDGAWFRPNELLIPHLLERGGDAP